MIRFIVEELEEGYLVTMQDEVSQTRHAFTDYEILWEWMDNKVPRWNPMEVVFSEGKKHIPGPDTRP